MKMLACLAMIAAVRSPTAPLGPMDYFPPFTTARAAEIDVNLRPDVKRICAMTEHWGADEGCTLRGVTFVCYELVTEEWSRDTHRWKFDGLACRHSGTTEDIPPPDGLSQ